MTLQFYPQKEVREIKKKRLELEGKKVEQKVDKLPKTKMWANHQVLENMCRDYVYSLYVEEEFEYPLRQLFECLMTTFYGDGILAWIYKKDEREYQGYAKNK